MASSQFLSSRHQGGEEEHFKTAGGRGKATSGAGGCCGGRFAPSSLASDREVPRWCVWTLRVLNPLGFVAVCVVNYLASGALGGESIGDVSDDNRTPFTPAGYAFSIWGLIYLFQAILFLVYSFTPAVNKGLVFRRIGFWHLALCVFNCSWIFTFTYQQLEVSAFVIWAMLFCLAAIYARLHVLPGFSVDEVRRTRTWLEYFAVYLPWSLYTSWLVGASLLNVFIAIGNPPEDMISGGLAAMTVAAFLNIMILAWTRDVAFAAVNVWTLVAISNQSGVSPMIWGAALALAGVVGASAVAAWVLNAAELLPSSWGLRSRKDGSSLKNGHLHSTV